MGIHLNELQQVAYPFVDICRSCGRPMPNACIFLQYSDSLLINHLRSTGCPVAIAFLDWWTVVVSHKWRTHLPSTVDMNLSEFLDDQEARGPTVSCPNPIRRTLLVDKRYPGSSKVAKHLPGRLVWGSKLVHPVLKVKKNGFCTRSISSMTSRETAYRGLKVNWEKPVRTISSLEHILDFKHGRTSAGSNKNSSYPSAIITIIVNNEHW